MPERATIETIGRYAGSEVTLKGWIYNKRSSGKIQFLQLRDGTGILQCVMVKAQVPEEMFEAAKAATQETSCEVRGTVREDERAHGGYELDVTAYRTIVQAEPFPITKKEHGNAFLMDNRHLWLRSRRQVAIARVRALIIRSIRDYFDTHGFTLVDTPILTPAACEGTTTLFQTDYFGEPAYLSQSGQLYNEATCRALGKTYCFGPTFRAEKSKTRRHLTEFWMVEPEMAFCELDENMDVAEDFLVYVVQRVVTEGEAWLLELERDLEPLKAVQKPFVRLHYDEAVRLLQEAGTTMQHGSDLGAEDETVLTRMYDRPVMVHRYPAEVKAFYMKRDPAEPRSALCVDVLAPEGYGEVIGGGQREDDINVLVASIQKHGLPREAFEWYLDLRRYGSCPTAGFGLGIERTVSWLCGLHHVRETIAFPRMLEKIVP